MGHISDLIIDLHSEQQDIITKGQAAFVAHSKQ